MPDLVQVILAVVATGLAFAFYRTSKRLDEAREELAQTQEAFDRSTERFAGVVDADAEEARVRGEAAEATHQLEELRASYGEKKAIYDRLLHEIAIFDERLSFAEMGVYEPHFEFSDSEEYKREIVVVREQQKQMVAAKTAVYCTTKWHVDGSLSKGQTMTNRNIRLTLRAFNNECDAAIANTRWNNVNAMEKRILRAYEQIII